MNLNSQWEKSCTWKGDVRAFVHTLYHAAFVIAFMLLIIGNDDNLLHLGTGRGVDAFSFGLKEAATKLVPKPELGSEPASTLKSNQEYNGQLKSTQWFSPPRKPLDPILKEGQRPNETFLGRLDVFLTKLQDPTKHLEDHTYLNGNYAPVLEENVLVPVEVVEGALPSDMDGMFIRNGPNPSPDSFVSPKRYHWFDGHAMLHNLRISDGEAFYTNQFVPSTRYRIEKELGQAFFPTLGEYTGFLGLMKILFHPTMVRKFVPDLTTVLPPNTSCIFYKNKFYCLNEGSRPFECRLMPDGTLEPVGYETFGGVLDFPVSAHPRVDHNGDLLFHSYTSNTELVESQGNMKFGRYSNDTDRIESYFVPTAPDEKYVSFAHNLLFTENYAILWDCSVHFDPRAMFDGGSYFRTNPDYTLRFGIIPKSAKGRDDVIWIDTGKPGGIVHPLNAWEDEDGNIVLWTPFCEDLVLDLETEDINKFNMVEFRLDLSKKQVVGKEVIDDDMNIEFSVVPRMGDFTRYGYTAIQCPSTPGEGSFSGFCVWDMVKRKVHKSVLYNSHEVGGEPMVCVVPNAKAGTQDKIYVGTYVYNMKEEQTYFLLFDGDTKDCDLVARLKMPYRVPFGFHGIWASSQELEGHFEHHQQKESMVQDDGVNGKS